MKWDKEQLVANFPHIISATSKLLDIYYPKSLRASALKIFNFDAPRFDTTSQSKELLLVPAEKSKHR